jgi:hypothetical protein
MQASTSFARQLAAAYLLENRYLSKVIPVLGAICGDPAGSSLDHPSKAGRCEYAAEVLGCRNLTICGTDAAAIYEIDLC